MVLVFNPVALVINPFSCVLALWTCLAPHLRRREYEELPG